MGGLLANDDDDDDDNDDKADDEHHCFLQPTTIHAFLFTSDDWVCFSVVIAVVVVEN